MPHGTKTCMGPLGAYRLEKMKRDEGSRDKKRKRTKDEGIKTPRLRD